MKTTAFNSPKTRKTKIGEGVYIPPLNSPLLVELMRSSLVRRRVKLCEVKGEREREKKRKKKKSTRWRSLVFTTTVRCGLFHDEDIRASTFSPFSAILLTRYFCISLRSYRILPTLNVTRYPFKVLFMFRPLVMSSRGGGRTRVGKKGVGNVERRTYRRLYTKILFLDPARD